MLKDRFALWCVNQLGKPVLWGAKGYAIFDCSGLVSCGIQELGGPDHRQEWNAQHFADALPFAPSSPEPGDLGFYGPTWEKVEHVVVALLDGHLVSADGASSHILTLQEAQARGCSVRLHQGSAFRGDIPFLGWRTNSLLG